MGKAETANLKRPTLGELVDQLQDLREKRAKLAAQDKPLKEEYDAIAEQVMAMLDEVKSDGTKTKRASVSIKEVDVPVVKDVEQVVRWAVKTKSFQIFTNSCVSSPAWRELIELNPKHTPPPGTEVFTKRSLNHTSLKG